MIRFIHSADWQLGMTRRFLSQEAAQRFAQARIDAIVRLGELAREHEARFIVVAGDVFESNQVDRATLVRSLDAMRAAEIPVLLLPGNHDPLDAASIFRCRDFIAKRPDNVVVLDDVEPVQVAGVSNVEVIGAPWANKRPLVDLLEAALSETGPPGTKFRICVGHGAVDTLSPDPDNPALIRVADLEQRIRDGHLHFVALGDRHSATRVGSTGAIWYSGTPVVTAFDEVEPNQALLVTLAANEQPAVEALQVGQWRFEDVEFTLRDADDIEQLGDWLSAQPAKERTVLYLTLEGTLGIALKARLDELLHDYTDYYASLRIHERTSELAVLPDSVDADALGLSGYARQAWDRLSEEAGTAGDESQVAIDALSLLYRLSRGGSG